MKLWDLLKLHMVRSCTDGEENVTRTELWKRAYFEDSRINHNQRSRRIERV